MVNSGYIDVIGPFILSSPKLTGYDAGACFAFQLVPVQSTSFSSININRWYPNIFLLPQTRLGTTIATTNMACEVALTVSSIGIAATLRHLRLVKIVISWLALHRRTASSIALLLRPILYLLYVHRLSSNISPASPSSWCFLNPNLFQRIVVSSNQKQKQSCVLAHSRLCLSVLQF